MTEVCSPAACRSLARTPDASGHRVLAGVVRTVLRGLPILIALLGQAPLLHAQWSPAGLASASPDQREAAASPRDLNAERSRVQSHLDDAEAQLSQVKDAQESSATAPDDGDRQELEERVDLLQARVQIARRHRKLLDEAEAVRDEREQLEGEANAWTGFANPPPYASDFVEEIARNLRSQQTAIKTDEARLASFAQGKALARSQLERAERVFRQTLEDLESAATDEAKQQARRRQAFSQLSLTVAGESLAFVRAREQTVTDRLGLRRVREGFLRRQLDVALQAVHLTEKALQGKVDALAKQLDAANEYLTKTNAAEEVASQQLAALRLRVETGEETGDVDPHQRLAMQLKQAQLDAIRAAEDDVNLRIGYLQMHQAAWRERFELYRHWDFTKAREQSSGIETVLESIEQGMSALELAQAEVADFRPEARFAGPALSAPREALIKATRERAAQLVSTLGAARQLRDFLELWKQEMAQRIGGMGTQERARGWGEAFLDYLKRLWSFELLSVDDTLVVEGQPLVEKRPVSLGKVIEAALILTVGLFGASGLSGLLSRIILPFSAGKWHRRLLIQKLLRIAMIALVVVLALVTVKIPLTVFAFLGGAIALGIGFGAKNLLNNFISGFILLGEGTIRAGDWIDIEGTRGIVETIGDRSTRVRRLDGVHMLIPNSHFLESSVTNMTLSDQRVRTSITVSAAYGSPTRDVQALLCGIAEAHEFVVVKPPPVVVFEDFGESALVFRLYVWIDLRAQDDYRAVLTELRHRIAERFAEQGIQMAFPQRDLHLDVKRPIPVRMFDDAGVRSESTGSLNGRS